MTEVEYIESIRNVFMNEIYSCIPNKWISGNGSSGPVFEAYLSTKNKKYQNSQYYFDEKREFIHWTSVQNLLSIINQREIRFYNLQNSKDSEEFKYAASQLNIPDDLIEYSKNFLYTFSFCKSIEIDNAYLWNTYGREYQGVAIEFEIMNSPDMWDNFMLAQVYYELPNQLITLKEKLEDLIKEYPQIETKIDLGRLIAFHKHPDHSKELEIRIATFYPFTETDDYWKNYNTEFIFEKNRPRITNYFGLNLWVDNESPYMKCTDPKNDRRLLLTEDYFIERPQIKLKNIYFGNQCGITNLDYNNFKINLEEIIKYKLGYLVKLPIKLFGQTFSKKPI
jgi:hypothetical protein